MDLYPNVVIGIHGIEILPTWQLSSPVGVAQKTEHLPSMV